ncbi:MAG TPA: methyltransferase domain-containing protein [Verrucomicrobiae bacterium]|jgi:trans-aconitate 2-methyltransferase
MPAWDAKQYLRFNDERTRPCRDLVARIAAANPGRVIDLGCGPGNSAAVLAERWPRAALAGLDSSSEMIAAARSTTPSVDWSVGDIAAWAGEDRPPFDVIFSNAAMQWAPGHAAVFPKLLNRAVPGGALAIQVPGNFEAPAHCLMRELAATQAWSGHFRSAVREWHVENLAAYYDILAPGAASLDFWETEYLHIMPDAAAIVEWYKGAGLRPFLDALPNDEAKAAFTAAYLERIRRAYPCRANGTVLFPFRRLFLIAYRK